ncbi:MAG: 2-amino-4-hydroxy-6-hydroxymethyldihydropteridine diphosphokinase [Cyanobacteria bacterium J06642_2]
MHYVSSIQTNADPLPQASSIPQWSRVAIGIGSNLGVPQQQIAQGVQLLQQHPRIDIIRLSPFYWTSPVYQHERPEIPHPAYLNGAAILDTALSPTGFMQICLDVEAVLGRVRQQEWQPRPLDLDILLWEEQQFDLPTVSAPHPRMRDRPFVLVPLSQLVPHWRYPLAHPNLANPSLSYPSVAELAEMVGWDGVEIELPLCIPMPHVNLEVGRV